MERVSLLRKVSRAARMAGIRFELLRQGGAHEFWVCGSTRFAVPRHREIAEGTAEQILRDLELELGPAWWR